MTSFYILQIIRSFHFLKIFVVMPLPSPLLAQNMSVNYQFKLKPSKLYILIKKSIIANKHIAALVLKNVHNKPLRRSFILATG